jgi:hypothetical protein
MKFRCFDVVNSFLCVQKIKETSSSLEASTNILQTIELSNALVALSASYNAIQSMN